MDAFIKNYYINKGVNPDVVDKMSARLVKNIKHIDFIQKQNVEFKNFADKNKARTHDMIDKMMGEDTNGR